MIEAFQSMVGLPYEETVSSVDERFSDRCQLPYFAGFKKLLADRCDTKPVGASLEPDEECSVEEPLDREERRWARIMAAQSLRRETLFPNKEAFQEGFAAQEGRPFSQLAGELYGDLPEFLPITAFEPIGAKALIHLYNCALVQGLLIQAERVRFRVPRSDDVAIKRALFRAIRFHRLLIEESKQEGDQLIFSVTGPLSLFENSASYGMRVANFFPHLLQMKSWELEASLSLKAKQVLLSLNEADHPMESHYRALSGYVPKELGDFMSEYNKKSQTWEAALSGDFLQLGHGADCFPDFVFVHRENKSKIYMELFHRWHKADLLKRLEVLQKKPTQSLIIGVSQKLLNDSDVSAEMSKFCEEDQERKIFTFRDFPTPSGVAKILNKGS